MNETAPLTPPAKTTPPDATAPARRQGVRWLVRSACFLAAAAAMLAAPHGFDWCWRLPALSPLVATASLLAAGVFYGASVVGLLIGLITVLRRRWFCRWVCPTGFCADASSRLGARCGRKPLRMPPIGQWIALATLAAACLGYPLFLWLDPLAIFSAAFTGAGPEPEWPARWAAAALPVIVLLSLLLPHIWCHRICPLGGLQDLLARLAFRRRRDQNSTTTKAESPEGFGPVARRTVLFSLIGLAWAAAVRKIRAASPAPLRPPGAVGELQFPGVCIRCGNCIRACPAKVLHPDMGDRGIAGWLAPLLRFAEDYCREDCVQCTLVCPSGALQPVAVEDKQTTTIGFPRVDMNICLLGDDRDCAACRTHCPFEAIHFRFDEETYTLAPQIDPQRCPGCGACEVACPTLPAKAIVVEPRVSLRS